jgi:hypothetical protein
LLTQLVRENGDTLVFRLDKARLDIFCLHESLAASDNLSDPDVPAQENRRRFREIANGKGLSLAWRYPAKNSRSHDARTVLARLHLRGSECAKSTGSGGAS